MSQVGMEYSAKGILKELLSYKSGLMGISMLILLIAISAFAILTIPYHRAIELWRGEEMMWIENPRNAQPIWVKYLTGKNLPENIVLDTREARGIRAVKTVTPIPRTNFKRLYIEFTFNYDYDGFPSEVNIFLYAKYNESAPYLRIYWIKPGDIKLDLVNHVLRTHNDILFLTIDENLGNKLQRYIASVVGENPKVIIPTTIVLFAQEDESLLMTDTAKPLRGIYKVIIEGTLFGEESDLDARLVVYGRVHGLTGTDHLRRDLTIAILWGTPVALAFGLTASLTVSIIQLIIATVSGYYGGWIDSLIQRLTEVYMILPFLPFLILIATFYRIDIWVLLIVVIVLSIFGGGIKSTRALVMQIKEYPYIEAARAYGASAKRIIFLYIIPKILPPQVPGLIGAVPGFVFLEAALSFLGLGDPYLPTWGKIINDAFSGGALYKGYYYWVLEPSFMLILTAFAFSFLGFALDKIVNPRLREM